MKQKWKPVQGKSIRRIVCKDFELKVDFKFN